jgi:hypothetical protein
MIFRFDGRKRAAIRYGPMNSDCMSCHSSLDPIPIYFEEIHVDRTA